MGIVKALTGSISGPAIKEGESPRAFSLPDTVSDKIASWEEVPGRRFRELAGLSASVRQQFLTWKYELTNPGDIRMKFRAILLSGPTGVGKTEIVEALIKEAGEYVVRFDPDKFGRENGLNMHDPQVFFAAVQQLSVELEVEDQNRYRGKRGRQNRSRTLVVVLNEADKYFQRRTEVGNETVTTDDAINVWDELKTRKNVWVFGTTNHTEFMSEAIFGRFQEELAMKKPQKGQLIDLFAYYIALIDKEGQEAGRDLFDASLIDSVNEYRKIAEDYWNYVDDHPNSKPDDDATLKRKASEVRNTAEPLAKLLANALSVAIGLSQRDIANVMEVLGRRHDVFLSRNDALESAGMDTEEVKGITIDDIRVALAQRKMDNLGRAAKVREGDALRRGR